MFRKFFKFLGLFLLLFIKETVSGWITKAKHKIPETVTKPGLNKNMLFLVSVSLSSTDFYLKIVKLYIVSSITTFSNEK